MARFHPASLRNCCLATLGLAFATITWTAHSAAQPAKKPVAAAPVDFNRDIRPILSENCFVCHGPDEGQRKAKLRLDTRGGALGKLRGGGHAIVPGKADASELVRRILTEDDS